MKINGIVFDKDGTLFDFGKTWNVWAQNLIRHFAAGDSALEQKIAKTIHFDLTAGQYHPDSPLIAGTNRLAAELFASALSRADVDNVEHYISRAAAQAPLAPAVDLPDFLQRLKDRDLTLGVMTNDSEFSAIRHLRSFQTEHFFDLILGFDSGYGAKPDPDPLLHFAAATGLAAKDIAMVGDSTHDLIAGRAAGMKTIGVLTGMADAEELAPFADVVLPDIGHILDLIS